MGLLYLAFIVAWVHYIREIGRLQCVDAMPVLFGAGDTLAVLERWLPYAVTILDRFCCTSLPAATDKWSCALGEHPLAL